MDPKNLNTLDPKLKEVYERVMGTSIPTAPSAQTPASPVSSSPPASPAPQPTVPQAPAQSTPADHPSPSMATPAPEKPVIDYAAITAKPPSNHSSQQVLKPSGSTSSSFGVVNTGNDKQKSESADTEKKGSQMKMIFLLILVPVFLIAYTFVWIMIFGIDVMSILPV